MSDFAACQSFFFFFFSSSTLRQTNLHIREKEVAMRVLICIANKYYRVSKTRSLTIYAFNNIFIYSLLFFLLIFSRKKKRKENKRKERKKKKRAPTSYRGKRSYVFFVTFSMSIFFFFFFDDDHFLFVTRFSRWYEKIYTFSDIQKSLRRVQLINTNLLIALIM